MPRTASRRNPAQTTRRQTVRRRPLSGEMGGTETETVTVTDAPQRAQTNSRRRNRSLREYGPTQQGDRATAGVGLLEAEFLGSIFLLILLMFVNPSKSYGDKIMAIMKRGTMLSVLFFMLALISGTGPNASKVAKAIGALVFVATLLTSPGSDVITALDNLFKANWSGTTEHGTDTGQSDQPGQTTPSGDPVLGAASGAISRITQIIQSFGFGFLK